MLTELGAGGGAQPGHAFTTATRQDGRSASLTAPNGHAQQLLLQAVTAMCMLLLQAVTAMCMLLLRAVTAMCMLLLRAVGARSY